MKRPEYEGPPQEFYGKDTAKNYDHNSRIINIQQSIAYRCIDLLEVTSNAFLLDIGCGTGWSGSAITNKGYKWIGVDISIPMLLYAQNKNESTDLIQCDIGNGLPFTPGVFDGIISVSVLQWLFQSYSIGDNPILRIRRFMQDLFSILKKEAKAVLQFYPDSKKQIEVLKNEAKRAGFEGGLIIDNEGTKNIKYYLLLESRNTKRRENKIKKKESIYKKKELLRKKGYDLAKDSKYSGRRRCGKML